MTLPPVSDRPFNQELKGVFGEFGAGAGVQALYLQSALEPATLGRISMLSDVEGSEKWSVRDLFQREVDQERVRRQLMPYLATEDRIKFFNPLTLTLLPDVSRDLAADTPRLTETTEREGDFIWRVLSHGDNYRIRWGNKAPEWATLEWNDARVRLVAIDGQHRLSAMRRLWNDHSGGHLERLSSWRIPVVVVTFRTEGRVKSPPRLVEVVRRIFVYINTTAQVVSPARRILLSDESPAAICTQEIIENAHRNDLQPLDERQQGRLPLLCYDWRGAESAQRAVRAPAALKNVEELRDWFFYYILGCEDEGREEPDEFTSTVRSALGIPPIGPLHDAFSAGRIDHRSARLLREHCRGHLLPFVEQVLEAFTPYRGYVSDLRQLEDRYCDGPSADLARHAFDELRFGTCRADELVLSSVQIERREIEHRIEEIKHSRLPGLIRREIGMRGVMAAFGRLRIRFRNPKWQEYTPRFIKGLNLLYANGWLDPEHADHRGHLRHIVEDSGGKVVNYRIHEAPDALGAYLELLTAAYGGKWPESCTKYWRGAREMLFGRLERTVLRGYRREVRARLREEDRLTAKEMDAAVKRESEDLAAKHVRRLRVSVDRVRDAYRGC